MTAIIEASLHVSEGQEKGDRKKERVDRYPSLLRMVGDRAQKGTKGEAGLSPSWGAPGQPHWLLKH